MPWSPFGDGVVYTGVHAFLREHCFRDMTSLTARYGRGSSSKAAGIKIEDHFNTLVAGGVVKRPHPQAKALVALLDGAGYDVIDTQVLVGCPKTRVATRLDALLRRRSDGADVVMELKTGGEGPKVRRSDTFKCPTPCGHLRQTVHDLADAQCAIGCALFAAQGKEKGVVHGVVVRVGRGPKLKHGTLEDVSLGRGFRSASEMGEALLESSKTHKTATPSPSSSGLRAFWDVGDYSNARKRRRVGFAVDDSRCEGGATVCERGVEGPTGDGAC